MYRLSEELEGKEQCATPASLGQPARAHASVPNENRTQRIRTASSTRV